MDRRTHCCGSHASMFPIRILIWIRRGYQYVHPKIYANMLV